MELIVGFVVFLLVVAAAAPLIVHIAGVPGPNELSTKSLDASGLPSGPSSKHPFGVDSLGRDVFGDSFSRVSAFIRF